MGGTKILVLKLREIIKALVFVTLGIALILLLIYLFMPKKEAKTEQAYYKPGTYTASVALYNGSADVEVIVSQSEILSVDIKNLAKEQEVFYPLLMPTMSLISAEIVESQTLLVEVPSENAITGQVLLNAVNKALETAKAQ